MHVSLRVLTLACIGALFVAGCKDSPPDASASGRGPARKAKAAYTATTEKVGHVQWGADDNTLVKNVPEEAAPVAPSAFVMDSSGRAHVLDRAANRIQIFEQQGSRWSQTKAIPLPEGDYVDLERKGAGYILLDRDLREAVTFVDGTGKETSTVRLAGDHIPEAGYVKALRVRNDNVWVQLADNTLVQVTDGSEAASERHFEMGILATNGKRLLPIVKRPSDVRVGYLTETDKGALATLAFDSPVAAVTGFEVDKLGQTYVVVEVENSAGEVSDQIVVVLNRDGDELARGKLPIDESGLGCVRPLRLGEDGKLYQMRLTDDGVDFTRFVQ
jgi:hypothetical protein